MYRSAALALVVLATPLVTVAAVCPSLSLGSSGASVVALQRLLHTAYQGFPAPTGYFGPITEAAVKQWQGEHGIDQTGTLGPKTGAAMNLCDALPSASQSALIAPSATTTFSNGINLTGGCFAINGRCMTSGIFASSDSGPSGASAGGSGGGSLSKIISLINPGAAAAAAFQCPAPTPVSCSATQILVPGVTDSNGCKLQGQCIDLPKSVTDSLTSLAIPAAAVMPEGSPSNENQEGKVWSWVPSLQRMDLRVPKIFFGPGALDASTGNISLVSNTWVRLASDVPHDGIGFRAGLVGYLPKGRYGVFGQVAIATPSVNATYYVRVRQGTTEIDPTYQPRIAEGGAITVGGGIATSPEVANVPFTIPFSAPDIQYAGAPGHADEVWVEVYAENAKDGAGAALASSGQATNATISTLVFIRWDGLYGSN